MVAKRFKEAIHCVNSMRHTSEVCIAPEDDSFAQKCIFNKNVPLLSS